MFKKLNLKQTIVEMGEIFLIGISVVLLVYIFIGQNLEISGSSMYPFLHDKEQIITEKVSVKLSPLKRGEVIIFWHPNINTSLLVKRVIGLPGETIKIDGGKVYINNEQIKEPYLGDRVITDEGSFLQIGQEYTIPADSYVVMGDNRDESTDSRTWGPVKSKLVIGRAILVFYPFNSFRFIKY